MKSCVVLQGPIYQHCLPNLCNIIASVPNCIISTWKNENPEYIQILQNANPLKILLNDKPVPAGAQNLNYMTHSTSTGIDAAEELGFTHVLRFRTDYSASDFAKFLHICESMNPNKLVFMCWFTSHHHYLIDYFTFGPIPLMRKYYAARRDPDDLYFRHDTCNERFLQEKFFNKRPVVFEDTLDVCQFCIERAISDGVELYVIKDGLNTNDLFTLFINNALYTNI